MRKKRKNRQKKTSTMDVALVTALINLVSALIKLIEYLIDRYK